VNDKYPYAVVVGSPAPDCLRNLLRERRVFFIWWMTEESLFTRWATPGTVHVHPSPEALSRLVELHPDGLVAIHVDMPEEYLLAVQSNVFFRGGVVTYDDEAIHPQED